MAVLRKDFIGFTRLPWPRREVLGGGPRGEVGSAFADQLERQVWSEPMDLRQVDAQDGVKRRADVEPRRVRLPSYSVTRRRQLPGWLITGLLQSPEDGFDPRIA